MHAHGIDIFNEADGDHLALGVANDLQLQLLPTQHGLLHQHLADQAGADAARYDGAQLVHVVDQAAACAAHGISGTDNHRIAELLRDGFGFLHRISGLGTRHFDAQAIHGLLEGDAVLPALDGIHLHADDLHVILLQNARLRQLQTKI